MSYVFFLQSYIGFVNFANFTLQNSLSGTKVNKIFHIRNRHTQKFTKCKVFGAEIYELQSFLSVMCKVRRFLHIVPADFYTWRWQFFYKVYPKWTYRNEKEWVNIVYCDRWLNTGSRTAREEACLSITKVKSAAKILLFAHICKRSGILHQKKHRHAVETWRYRISFH